jgi:hypothetical protein
VGPGKITAPLSAFRNVLSAFYSVGVMLAWYQQAGRCGKYVDVSRKWSRYFALTPFWSLSNFRNFDLAFRNHGTR